MFSKRLFIFVVPLFLLVAAFFVGRYSAPGVSGEKVFVANATENFSVKYPLLNKTVTSDLDKHFIINFLPLRENLESIRKQFLHKSYIYFLYLNNGSWIGLDEREKFTAASTVKVPLAMAAYKAAEEGKIDLHDYYVLEGDDLDNGFGEGYKLGAGTAKTVDDFIGLMLEKSDNTAKNAVANSLSRVGVTNPLAPVYEFFGWTFDIGEEPIFAQISLKTLSNMFIALYNAKYLNMEHSSDILDYLSKTPFNDQIAAGVPEGVRVAHKIGVADDDRTYSDCGIVYAPNRHYILCLGVSGAEKSAADKFIANVSRNVYDYVISH